jgi:sulfatase modifying factor 1
MSRRYNSTSPWMANWIYNFNRNTLPKPPLPPPLPPPEKFELITVPVGDISNNQDPNSKIGQVNYYYNISKYPITIKEYCNFLNSVATISDTYGLYNSNMSSSYVSSGITKTTYGNTSTYTPTGPNGYSAYGSNSPDERPITYVSYISSIRFANWLTNGQPTGIQDATTTEDGSYLIQMTNGIYTITKKTNTNIDMYYLPTENEWYKAAYYNINYNNTGSPGYYLHATQSDVTPTNVLSDYTATSNCVNYISPTTGNLCVTQETDINTSQNYLTNVGAGLNCTSYYGTYDQTGNIWECVDIYNTNPYTLNSVRLRGGAWTSFISYINKNYSFDTTYNTIGSNAGFRLTKIPKSSGTTLSPYEVVKIDYTDNLVDNSTGFGNVDYEYYIGKYNVTIGQYCDFLNAIAKTDTYSLYKSKMSLDVNTAGINRSGVSGSYVYSVINNLGVSSNRPITYITTIDVIRYANWLTNGQTTDLSSTELGSYNIEIDASNNYTITKIIDESKNMYYLPTENEWYKSAYYSPNYNNTGNPGYYLYATQSDATPNNMLSESETTKNGVNYVKGVIYCVTQSAHYDVKQNYLTDVGIFSNSPSFFGTYDQTGSVYNILHDNHDDSPINTHPNVLRAGFWAGGSVSMWKYTRSVIPFDYTPAETTGFRLVMYPKIEL